VNAARSERLDSWRGAGCSVHPARQQILALACGLGSTRWTMEDTKSTRLRMVAKVKTTSGNCKLEDWHSASPGEIHPGHPLAKLGFVTAVASEKARLNQSCIRLKR
jgi:hypothetical protein